DVQVAVIISDIGKHLPVGRKNRAAGGGGAGDQPRCRAAVASDDPDLATVSKGNLSLAERRRLQQQRRLGLAETSPRCRQREDQKQAKLFHGAPPKYLSHSTPSSAKCMPQSMEEVKGWSNSAVRARLEPGGGKVNRAGRRGGSAQNLQ